MVPAPAWQVFLADFGVAAVEIRAVLNLRPSCDDKAVKQAFLLRAAEIIASKGVRFAPSVVLSES